MSRIKTTYYHLYGNAEGADGKNHIVTVVGKLEQGTKVKEFNETTPVEVREGAFVEGELRFKRKMFNRKLTLSMSICHPLDSFDIEKGIEIAKARIERGEILGSLETSSVTMLTDDAVMAELLVKLQWITGHIDDYLPEE
jgi:hypothetical protein